MEYYRIILTSAVCGALLTSCQSKTGTGILAGGAGGAAIGGLVGGGEGALIGGAVGVIAGGLIGGYLDNEDAKKLKETNKETYEHVDNGDKLTVTDIINLTKADISDDKIIELIQKTNSRYVLNNYQVERLKDMGVSERVINYMMFNT